MSADSYSAYACNIALDMADLRLIDIMSELRSRVHLTTLTDTLKAHGKIYQHCICTLVLEKK